MPVQFATPEPLHAFMRLILEQPDLQARLAPILEPDAFEVAVRAIAAEHGVTLPDGMLQNLFAPDPLGLSRWQDAPVTSDRWPGPGWLPTRSVPGDPPALDWSWLGDRKTDAPLFEDDVRRAGAYPFDRMFRTRTSLDALIGDAGSADTVPLSGFVFHMSRCGSTLLARILGAPPKHLVASEPEPLDAVILWAEQSPAPYALKLAALRAVVAGLGRRRGAGWQRFFIKLDGWHILSHRLLRDAFPEVPWVFLHRDPIEVMASLEAMPGLQSVPGLLPESLLGIENAHAIPQDEYSARVLAQFCRAALGHAEQGGGMIVDYDDLVGAALDTIPRHFGFAPDPDERAAMEAATRVYSKNPSATFAPDSRQKRAAASERMHELAQTHLAEVRRALLTLT